MYIDARDAFESNGVVIRIEYEIINRYTAYVMDGKLIWLDQISARMLYYTINIEWSSNKKNPWALIMLRYTFKVS